MAYDACIVSILEATGGKLTDKDLGAVLDDILRRKGARERPGEPAAAAMKRIAEEFGREMEEAEAIAKRQVYENATKRIARRGVQASAPSPERGIEATLVGVNAAFPGSRDSVDAAQNAMKLEWLGGLDIDLRKAGLEKHAASGIDDIDIATELGELNAPRGGKPGSTGNKKAAQIAGILKKYQQAAMEAVNRAGGWVRPYGGYVARTVHDPDKIRGLGPTDLLTGRFPPEAPAQAAWMQFVLDHADLNRTFGGRDQALKALPSLWHEFVTGEHLKDLDISDDVLPFAAGANVARKQSASRVIHWKSPAAWAAYNQKYGAGSVAAAVVHGLNGSAKAAGLMQKFGTNPEAALDADIKEWHKALSGQPGSQAKLTRLDKAEPMLRNQMMVLDGSISRPVDAVSAARLQAWMRVQRLAKLGSAPFAAVMDLATKAVSLRYQGVPFLQHFSTALRGYLPQHWTSAERGEAAEVLRAGIDSRINHLSSRFESDSARPGMAATAEHLFFKYTGLSAMTDNQRADAQVMMARHIGLQKGKGFDALPRGAQEVLSGMGFDARTWDLLKTGNWKVGDGDYFTPQIVDSLDDAALKAFAGSKRLSDVKADLRQKIMAYTWDNGIHSVLEPTARVRATMTQGRAAGDFMGNAIRLIGQFKSFPVAMLQQTWGRELYGGQGKMGKLAGVTELMVGSLVLGYVSMTLRDIASGRTPRDPSEPSTIAAAFLAGGGMSIYGDLLFGSYSRTGASAGDMLLGPTFGQVSSTMDLYSKWKSGDDGAAEAFRLLKQNMPGQNVWMTREVLDFLVIYRIQEALNPGYLGRLQSRLEDQNHQSWWLPPSAAH